MRDTVILTVGLSFIGIFGAFYMMITAYRSRAKDDNINRYADKLRLEKRMLVIFCLMCFANFVYAVIGAAIAYMMTDRQESVIRMPCIVLGAATMLCSLVQGYICRRDIEGGSVSDMKEASRTVVKMSIAEIMSVIALVYFFMGISGQV